MSDDDTFYDVFLCYKWEDGEAAEALRVALVSRGFRVFRDVIEGEPGAAGGEDEADALMVSEALEGRDDRLAVVGNDLVLDLEARLLAEPDERRARHVLALAAGERGRDRKHGGAGAHGSRRQSWRPPDFSSSVTSAISTPRSMPLTMS